MCGWCGLIVGSQFAGPQASLLRGVQGDDFLPSYMGGTFVRQGRTDLTCGWDRRCARHFFVIQVAHARTGSR